jgi:putative oxidoreductase
MGPLNALFDRVRPFALPYLRVIVGGTMAWHGFKKFDDGIDGTKSFFDFLSIPAPGLFAWVVAVLELFGGIMIVLGFLTRIVSLLFIVELLVAVFRYKYGEDVGMIGADQAGAELDWALISGFVILLAYGAGAWSVDALARLDGAPAPPPAVE